MIVTKELLWAMAFFQATTLASPIPIKGGEHHVDDSRGAPAIPYPEEEYAVKDAVHKRFHVYPFNQPDDLLPHHKPKPGQGQKRDVNHEEDSALYERSIIEPFDEPSGPPHHKDQDKKYAVKYAIKDEVHARDFPQPPSPPQDGDRAPSHAPFNGDRHKRDEIKYAVYERGYDIPYKPKDDSRYAIKDAVYDGQEKYAIKNTA